MNYENGLTANHMYTENDELVLECQTGNDREFEFDLESLARLLKCYKLEHGAKKLTCKFDIHNSATLYQNVVRIVDFFSKKSISCVLSDDLKQIVTRRQNENSLFEAALNNGTKIKDYDDHNVVLGSAFKRKIKKFQKKSVDHLSSVRNSANFSVPGSGKTTIAYAAISRWLEDGEIDKIVIIGPTSSFMSWEEEYEKCFDKKPKMLRISGSSIDKLKDNPHMYDVIIMHYQTMATRKIDLAHFLRNHKTVLIVDESHRIKNPNLDAKWSNAALELAPFAEIRIILSGTPMPNSYDDLWSQITFLWPNTKPFGHSVPYSTYVKNHNGITSDQKHILNALFCRIHKGDLNLPEPEPPKKVVVPLNRAQQEIYDFIAGRTRDEINSIDFRNNAKYKRKFMISRMVRLLQAASNPTLLHELSSQFEVNDPLFRDPDAAISAQLGIKVDHDTLDSGDLLDIYEKIENYQKLEIPSKMIEAATIAKQIADGGDKVIIWSSFLHNMQLFKTELLQSYDPLVINGSISRDPNDDINRDMLVKQFKEDPDCKILIATPASLGESVSLHINSRDETVCKNAIYLDRNYNGAQYLQSLDRIHRLGMSPDTKVRYHLIIGKNTIDEEIHNRLEEKANTMNRMLQDDYRMDMRMDLVDISNTELEKDYEALVKHLRERE